jgi:hypothetical protein
MFVLLLRLKTSIIMIIQGFHVGFYMMQYLHMGTYENHPTLIEGDWVTIQSKNVIFTSTLNHHVYNGSGFL